jgi:hypothetical protein
MHPLMELKFVSILKYKKYRVSWAIQSLVLVIDKYQYGEKQVANLN